MSAPNAGLRLLDLAEAAAICHVSPHTVRKWVRDRKLQPTRICRRLLFHPDELARFLSAHQAQLEVR